MITDYGANLIINLLTDSGYEAYAVGGAVRDYIMKRPTNDIDITTNALPLDVEKVLENNNIKFIETGLKHGTITALINSIQYEITTFRTDGEYGDNRHPNMVEFVSDVTLDLARRDFTMNAIAYNINIGFVDAFGGQTDIKNKIIRAVGDPDLRFKEDALRIMRAIRFSSTFGFSIEEETKKAIFSNKELLNNVAPERIFTELTKLLLGDFVFETLIEYKEIIAVIIPEISLTFDCTQNNPWHIYDVYTHIAKSVTSCKKDAPLRLAMLFHDIGKPHCKTTDDNGIDHFYAHPKTSEEITKEVLNRFNISTELFNRVTTLVRIHDGFIRNNDKSIKKNLNKYSADITYDLIEVKKADMKAQNLDKTQGEINELDETKKRLDKIINSNELYSISSLAINGNDLKKLGLSGKEIGDALSFLVDSVIDEKVENKKDNLISYIKNNKL